MAPGQSGPVVFAPGHASSAAPVEATGSSRCVREDSSSGTSLSRSAGPARSHDHSQGQSAPSVSGSRLEPGHGGSDTADGGASAPPVPCIKSEQMKARLPAKASDYGLERFNRLLERLDRGNFLIKTSFKKSYSLILMSARGSIPAGDPTGGGTGGVESSGNDSTASTNTANGDSKTDGSGRTVGCNSSSISNSSNSSTGAPSSGISGPGASFKRLQQQTDKRPLGGSLRGWYPRTRGILIKANSSTGIYQLAGMGRAESVTLAQVDNHQQQHESLTALSTEQTPTERRTSGQRKAVPGTDQPETAPTNTTTTATIGHNYNGNSLAPGDSVNDGPMSLIATSEKDPTTTNNESDELCRSEVYDNDSGSGSGGRTEQLLNNRSALHVSPRNASVEPCRNNYENIRPSTHRSRQRLSSLDGTNHTLGSGSRKLTARKKSNAASTGSEWDEDSWMSGGLQDDPDDAEHKLSSSFPHTSSGYYWQSTECAVPTRFFQRQDYVQPVTTDTAALDFPPDRSHAASQDGVEEQDADRDRGGKRTQGKKRWLGSKSGKNKTLSTVGLDANGTDIKLTVGNKDTAEHPFQLTALFGTGSHSGSHGRKRPDRVPQLKNINLHFPNKTSHQHRGYDDQTQHELRSSRAPTGNIPTGALFHQPPTGYHQLSLPPQPVAASHRPGASSSARGERKYFNKAKSHFLKLGQKWRLLTVSGGKARTAHRPGTGHHQQQQQQQHHQHHHISSYNLDDLIKATHRYGQENESANLSQKIVYKSYKSELDLTKNLAYLDSFLNEHFDQDGDRQRTVGRISRHKRAKSCSKTLDPSLKMAELAAGRASLNADELPGMVGDEEPGTDSTLEATAVTVPFVGCVSSNLIQLEDVWEGTGRGRGHWVTTNTSSSSSEYLRNNLSTARTTAKPNVKANKMRDFFRFDGAPGGIEDSTYGKVKAGEGEDEEEEDDDDEEEEEEDDENLELEDDDDARMLLFDSLASFAGVSGNGATVGAVSARTIQGAFVEQYGKNNATSSSLSSSDYASVYSATSSGGNGAASTPGPGKPSLHGAQFKLLATPEEGTQSGECSNRMDYSPQKHHQSSPKQQRQAHHLPRMNVMVGNNATNPFVSLSASEGPAGTSSHRIYNNFLDGSPRHQAALSSPGSPADQSVEKNHRLRKPQAGSGLPTGSVSPRGTDRYDYRIQPRKPSNSRSHFRQLVPAPADTDLTYQEDYLEHYQNAARARTLQPGHGDTEPALHFLHRAPYHRRRSALPAGGSNGEDLQNNALANENSDNDTDDESRMDALVKTSDSGGIVDDIATTDELLLLVNAAIDIRRSHAVDQPLLLGNARKKNTRKDNSFQRISTQTDTSRRAANEPLSDSESAANESKTLLAYRPQTQPPYETSSNQLYNGEFRSVDSSAPGVAGTRRTFAGLNHSANGPSAASKTGAGGMSNSYLGYGPHRVIVSQSRKERGEVVLEYEC